MKYDAIIFDLFGTLVDNFPSITFERVLAEMAVCVDAPQQEFVRMWHIDTWPMRAIGQFPTVEANVAYICRALGVRTEDEQLKSAAQLRFEFTRHALVPRHDTVETVASLKAMGYKTGLVSDCSGEVPLLWQDLSLAPLIDVPIFSCSVGLKKPDPRIFLLACERLDVSPQRCFYIGDGGSWELSAATKLGMHAVLINAPHEEPNNKDRQEAAEWRGHRVLTIKEILAMVDDDAGT